MTDPAKAACARLFAAALRYPGAHEEHPWGERVVKVKGKIFLFASSTEGRLTATTKLPASGASALLLPFTAPCGYNLGKSGWVTARFEAGADVPEDLLLAWLDESYRAVAPKRLQAELDGGAPPRAKPTAKARPTVKARKAPARAKARSRGLS